MILNTHPEAFQNILDTLPGRLSSMKVDADCEDVD